MSNTDAAPAEVACAPSAFTGMLHPREVPLGGPRAIRVRRTLPQRERSLIGAWCFADHYGPHDLRGGPGMDVPPHPHTGLQTVSWLFSGEVEHRDSAGVHALVRPGELNLMTAGAGICHSEVSTGAADVLHGAQLWVALPDSTWKVLLGLSTSVAVAVPLTVLGMASSVMDPLSAPPILAASLTAATVMLAVAGALSSVPSLTV